MDIDPLVPLRIAVPTVGAGGLAADRSPHFGKADSFTVVELVDGEVQLAGVITNPPHEHGGCGAIVANLAQSGVRVAIVVGMGQGPLHAMRAHGIDAFSDPTSCTPREAAEAYRAGTLLPFGGQHACGGH